MARTRREIEQERIAESIAASDAARRKPTPKRRPAKRKPTPKPTHKPVTKKPRDPRLWRSTRLAAEKALATIIDGAFPVKTIAKGKICVVRAPLIDCPNRSESALANGWSPELLAERIDELGQMPFTGKRRVLVRALAWLIDDEEGIAYDPQWITLIPKYAPTDGQSLRMAFVNAVLWLRHYIEALHQYTASKLLKFTMIEIAYWPMGPRSPTNGPSPKPKKRGKTR